MGLQHSALSSVNLHSSNPDAARSPSASPELLHEVRRRTPLGDGRQGPAASAGKAATLARWQPVSETGGPATPTQSPQRQLRVWKLTLPRSRIGLHIDAVFVDAAPEQNLLPAAGHPEQVDDVAILAAAAAHEEGSPPSTSLETVLPHAPLASLESGHRMVRRTLCLKGLNLRIFRIFRFRRCPASRDVVGCSCVLRPQAAVKRHEDVP